MLDELLELTISEELSLDPLISDDNEETSSDVVVELSKELLIEGRPASPQATNTRVVKKMEGKIFFLIKISFNN
jgi:hypothetical protein